MPEQVIQASYCTTCKGRLWQLRETLAHNLTVIGDDEEIVLVDFDSPDDLGTWVWESFGAEVEAGRLRFFELLDEAPWHAAKAKNLAHRLARGGFLFNLDADQVTHGASLTLPEIERLAGQPHVLRCAFRARSWLWPKLLTDVRPESRRHLSLIALQPGLTREWPRRRAPQPVH